MRAQLFRHGFSATPGVHHLDELQGKFLRMRRSVMRREKQAGQAEKANQALWELSN